ncbi:MAG: LytR family transcriptional regulator [Clostridia bacterium]|jgi:LCP family protein required for cell wall assembly|nr:LytR family transcriptional regulator [Clostridia bacterium]
MGGKRVENKKTGLKKFGKVLLIIFVIIIIFAGITTGVGVWYVNDKLGKLNYMEIAEEEIEITEGVKEKLKGYRTIAIFGVDSRANELEKGTRSDCVILATINEKTKEVQLTSVYRDTYLELTGRNLDKLTHAYAYGGPALAMSTLNTNLDLNITEFVTLNFDSVVDIVNAVGGISMNITNDELKYINGYIDEIVSVTGKRSEHISKTGKQNLNGVQALAYGRIRYTAGGDYKRTERMRDILMAVVNKAKKMSVGKLNSLADVLLPKVYTNIKSGEIIGLIPQLATYKIVDSTGWPYETKGATIGGVWYGPPVTLESNVKKLHETVYGQTNYQVSNKVKEISEKIIKKTGYK